MIWFLTLLLSVSMAHAKPKKKRRAAPEAKAVLTKVDTCAKTESTKKVLLIKQWHLSPKDNTKGFKDKYPQEQNQTAIYKVLNEKVKSGDVTLVVSEGCEGEITSEYKGTFNGWDMASLSDYRERKEFPKILTNVAMKLEAKYGEKLLTMCGDNDELIKEGNLRLSNLRGWTGYLTKLSSSNPAAVAQYSEAAAETLKVKAGTPVPQLVAKIKTEIRDDLKRLLDSLNDRNAGFVKVLEAQEFKDAAVVIGGLHAADLKARLETAGLNCEVFEPPGYARDSENQIREFQSLTAK